MGQNLIERRKCNSSETAVQQRLEKISEQWEILTTKTSEKSMKLKEANRQRTFIAAVKDLDFWLGEVDSLLSTGTFINYPLITYQLPTNWYLLYFLFSALVFFTEFVYIFSF